MAQQSYLCLTSDIIGSSEPVDQQKLRSLPELLQEVNRSWSPAVAFSLSSGDEFQGLLDLSQSPLDLIGALELALFPLRFRTGIGLGTVSTDIQDTTHAMRGETFENARSALKRALQEKRLYAFDAGKEDFLLDDLLLLVGFIKEQWSSETVFRRFALYRKYRAVEKVAREEGVSAEAVNKMVQRYGFREILRIAEDFQKALAIAWG
jgi:hypothetical protein